MRSLFKAWLNSNNAQELSKEMSDSKQSGIFVKNTRKLFV